MTTGSITSSELATLWVVYQKKTMMLRVIEAFLSNNQDPEALEILQSFYDGETIFVNEIVDIFKQEGAAIPIGYTENDVNLSAPRLFDDIYEIMYLRTMMKVAAGLHALHICMAYRQDIMEMYTRFSSFAEQYCVKATQFLLEKGVLSKSPGVTMPTQVEIAKEKDYRSGLKMMGKRRVLNTVEVAYLYQTIESNVAGMKLMTGFSQVAADKEARNYFVRGKELSKKIIENFSEVLLESDINVPTTAAGIVSNSTVSPFSDKLMMYNTSILTSFGLGSNALGTSFSLRKDLPAKMLNASKDILNFANDGGDIMIKNGWTEEPPQMEDRTQLSKGHEK
ncbi:DUF3231 family protein [Oceanobacillus sp. J11TS1]|uniref:DUF3231 family protein n=1 Tax=Oceanobacillus sp. J11TS1 TaxID=2807191 RepID=UPI001AFF5C6C|nr:DUF3231 family protein [Oceanobacillus sp. J11TS1]GIO24021.1 hypothetical protein J11TS1_26020 [Oceanobacillus sp. J11TS1]